MFISSTQNGIFINNLGRGEVTKLQYIVYNYLNMRIQYDCCNYYVFLEWQDLTFFGGLKRRKGDS